MYKRQFPQFGDVDGNGLLGIAYFNFARQSLIVIHDLDFGYATSVTLLPVGTRGGGRLADLDGDGDDDPLSYGLNAPDLGWFESLGTGQQVAAFRQFPGALGSGSEALPADVDGDGISEIFGVSLGSLYGTSYAGNGQHGAPFPIAAGSTVSWWGMAAGDIDLDGDLDLVAQVAGRPSWIENLGALQFGAAQPISQQIPSAVHAFLVDQDGDGDLDYFGASNGSVGYAENLTLESGCVQNASFESGSLAGWTAVDVRGAFVPLEVAGAGANPGFGMFDTEPTDGDYVFRTGFDGPGPFTITLAQDIAVGLGTHPLTFNYRAGWTILNPTAVLDRTFSVVVRDPSTGAALQTDLLVTAAAQTTNFDTGSLVANVDLSAFEGQTVTLSFEWYVPESNTGPAHFQLDNIRCPGSQGPSVGSNYCSAALNSSGAVGRMGASGSAVAAHNNLTLSASGLPPNQFGIFVTSMTQGFVPGTGGTSNGNLCLDGSIGRYQIIRNSGAAGAYSLALDLTAIPQGNGTMSALSGQTWKFQSWFRDGVGLGSNFTDGVSVTFL